MMLSTFQTAAFFAFRFSLACALRYRFVPFTGAGFGLRRRIKRVHHAVVVVINDVVQIFLERSIVDMLVMVSRYRAQLLWPEVIAVVKLRVIAIIVG